MYVISNNVSGYLPESMDDTPVYCDRDGAIDMLIGDIAAAESDAVEREAFNDNEEACDAIEEQARDVVAQLEAMRRTNAPIEVSFLGRVYFAYPVEG